MSGPDAETARGRAPARRAVFFGAFAAVIGLHILAIWYFVPPEVIFSEVPHSGRDYDTHIEQTWRVTEALERWGETWVYDVRLLAGYPNGTVFDSDNKGWELWTFALWKLGVPRGLAFNLFIMLAHLLVPWCVYLSARLFGLERWTALLAATLGLLLWYFDGFVHWTWWEGMLAYSMTGYLFLLPLALFWACIERRRWWLAAPCAALMAAAHLIHPYVFFALAFPMIALYVRHFRTLGARGHGVVLGIAIFTVGVNAYWIAVAIRFWGYVLDSGLLGGSGISHLATDYLGLVTDRLVSGGGGMRSGFRFLALGAAAVTLVLWRRDRDRRFLPFAVGIGLLLLCAYVGGYFWIARQVQPYRFVIPLGFLAAIPAAELAAEAYRRGALRGLPTPVYLLGAVLVVAAIPRLARDVLYFTPALIPEIHEIEDEKPRITDHVGFGAIDYPRHREYRLGPPPPDVVEITEWVNEHDSRNGRILVENWPLAEHLAWATHSQILGGFPPRNMAHSFANLFRLFPVREPPPLVFATYLEEYAVKWLIVSQGHERFDKRVHVLKKIHEVGPHRVYKSLEEVSYFREGSGALSITTNRIRVKDSPADEDLVLRFHFLETLVCEEGCELRREPIQGNRVGFIRVPAPHPESFTISNGY